MISLVQPKPVPVQLALLWFYGTGPGAASIVEMLGGTLGAGPNSGI